MDSRADIYSLGVVFYEMLTGELPGKRLEPPSRKVQIDVRLDEVVLRALEKNPDLRYQQVSEVKTMVETIVSSGSAAAPAATGDVSKVIPIAAKVGFVWIILFGFILVWFGVWTYVGGLKSSRQHVPILQFGFAAAIVSTVCGWLAVHKIRRSAGRLCGTGLAVLDGLFFPLLALDGLMGWVACGVVNAIGLAPLARMFPDPRLDLFLLLTILISLLADPLIVWRVWRAVNKPLAGGQPAPANSIQRKSGWRVPLLLLSPLAVLALILAVWSAASRKPAVVYRHQMFISVGSAGKGARLEGVADANARLTIYAGNPANGWSCTFPESSPFYVTLDYTPCGLDCRVTTAFGQILLNKTCATNLGNVVLDQGELAFRLGLPPDNHEDGNCSVTLGWWTPKDGVSIPVGALLTKTTVESSNEVAASAALFGPIIERTLNLGDDKEGPTRWWLDLDAGTVVEKPKDWFITSFAGPERNALPGLGVWLSSSNFNTTAIGMVFLRMVPNERWDLASPAAVGEELERHALQDAVQIPFPDRRNDDDGFRHKRNSQNLCLQNSERRLWPSPDHWFDRQPARRENSLQAGAKRRHCQNQCRRRKSGNGAQHGCASYSTDPGRGRCCPAETKERRGLGYAV